VKRSPRPRKVSSNLSDSVHQRLNMYAVAASAAGVGILALAQPADAKIVYTPAHVVIHSGRPFVVPLDLDHDGTIDFNFRNWWVDGTYIEAGTLSAVPARGGNAVWSP
jgi:hypothetical protein